MERSSKEELFTDNTATSSVDSVEVDMELKSLKEERISDEDKAVTSEEKFFLSGAVEVEYSLDSDEDKSSTVLFGVNTKRNTDEGVFPDYPAVSNFDSLVVGMEKKCSKEERISDEEEACMREEKVFPVGAVEVEYSSDNNEGKISPDMRSLIPKCELIVPDHEPVVLIKEEKMEDDYESGTQDIDEGSTSSGLTSVQISAPAHSVQVPFEVNFERSIKEEVFSDDETASSVDRNMGGTPTIEKIFLSSSIKDEYLLDNFEDENSTDGESKMTDKDDRSTQVERSTSSEIHEIPAGPAQRVTSVNTTDSNVCVEEQAGIQTRRKSYQCDVCEKQFFSSDSFNKHMKIHAGDKPFQCDECGQRFLRKFYLKSHLRTHTGEKPYQCDICQKKFSQSGYLKEHKMRHTAEKPFQCNECELRFSVSSDLKRHQRVHSGEKPFQCTVCPKQFWLNCDLKTHLRVHTGEKPFQCHECEQSFPRHWDLKKHQLTHTGEEPYQCDVCQKKFLHSTHFKKHKKSHTAEKRFQCDECEERFLLSNDLKKHQRIVHGGEKPFQCDICQKEFLLKGDLKTHRMIHTGEKPFQCDECEQRFSRQYHLNVHKRIHTGEKPFQCDVCQRQFTQKSTLTSHKWIHTSERPF